MFESIRQIVASGFEFFGDVVPTQTGASMLELPPLDAREHALRRLRDFVALLTFNTPGDQPGAVIPFQIERQNIHLYEPDNIRDLPMPAIGIIPGVAPNEPYGLGPAEIEDETFNVYAPGTALVRIAEHVETITIEAWAKKHPMRRAIVAGFRQVLRMDERSMSLRLSLPKYYDRVAQFTLVDTQPVDDGAPQERRRAMISVELRVPEVALVDVVEFRPSAVLQVVDSVELDP